MIMRISAYQWINIALIGSLILSPSTTFAWGVEGHRAIALIATDRLQGTHTLTRLSALLGALSLADIATCPDEVRNLEKHHVKMSATCTKLFPKPPKGTSDWHFINGPIKDADFEPTKADMDAACQQHCVTVEITNFLAVLAAAKPNDSAAQKLKQKQALSFVTHFIGDVHQPLHAADREGDAGGNAEHVKFFQNQAVLHGIWDSQIVSRVDATETALAQDLSPEIRQAAGEPGSEPMDWAIQSYHLARDVAYTGIPPANGNHEVAELGQPYQDLAAPVVRLQMARAGVRLAAALKHALP
jgi:hypothetical protein